MGACGRFAAIRALSCAMWPDSGRFAAIRALSCAMWPDSGRFAPMRALSCAMWPRCAQPGGAPRPPPVSAGSRRGAGGLRCDRRGARPHAGPGSGRPGPRARPGPCVCRGSSVGAWPRWIPGGRGTCGSRGPRRLACGEPSPGETEVEGTRVGVHRRGGRGRPQHRGRRVRVKDAGGCRRIPRGRLTARQGSWWRAGGPKWALAAVSGRSGRSVARCGRGAPSPGVPRGHPLSAQGPRPGARPRPTSTGGAGVSLSAEPGGRGRAGAGSWSGRPWHGGGALGRCPSGQTHGPRPQDQ